MLATLMWLKQICNRLRVAQRQPLGRGGQRQLARLRDIASVVAARQEKMLVFTQFREMTTPLATFLGGVFGRPGLILHGNTAVKDRKDLVRTFQEDEAVLFFILSLKAGGSGLEFDRGVPRRAFRWIAGGTRRWRTRLPTGPSASGRRGMSWFISSSARARSRKRLKR